MEEYLKQCVPKIVSDSQTELLSVYCTDLAEFIKTHSSLWDAETSKSLLSDLLRDKDSALSIFYQNEMDLSPPSTSPSLSIILDIGYIICVNEEVLSAVISKLYPSSTGWYTNSFIEEIHFNPAEVASLLDNMANMKSPQEVSTQLLLYFLAL